jgi:hypothetical protein
MSWRVARTALLVRRDRDPSSTVSAQPPWARSARPRGATKAWPGIARLVPLLIALSAAEGTARAEGTVRADEKNDLGTEHTIIVGVGGATELELGDASLHSGANVMVEWDVIEDWLEFEVGASALSAANGIEIPVDLLVKKPFKLKPWAEFMVGVGPEVVQVTGPNRGTHFGGEAALDFMFWPWGSRVGLWVEPEYDLVFQPSASSGIGTTGGVLLGW